MPKVGSFVKLLFDGLDDGGMAMPGHQGSETQVVVDVLVAVEIMNAAAPPVLHKERIGFVVAVVAGDS